jgi:glycosyltransferase involved in cell wall biosynthesis
LTRRSAVIVPGFWGQLSVAELQRLAAAGKRPRKDYVEVARELDADVIDPPFMREEASAVGRWVAVRGGILAGELYEAFVRRNRYRFICAWADSAGLPLALLHKLTRSRRDLALVSVYLSGRKKAMFVRQLKVHTHLGSIINFSSVQLEIARDRLGVPPEKLHHVPHPVDDRFWRPGDRPTEDAICSVGWEARDYVTLVRAVSGLPVRSHIAIGVAAFSSSVAEKPDDQDQDGARERARLAYFDNLKGTFSYGSYRAWMDEVRNGLPLNVVLDHQLGPRQLRSLYARCRFAVIPLQDVEFDAGVTALTEALAMGKAVILTRTRAQVDVIKDGEQGIYVRPGDPRALRAAVEYLLAHPEEAERMGRAGRKLIEEGHTLDRYAERVAQIVRGQGR